MPRKARIDAPGALHHVIARGIEKRNIFRDNFDRDNFLGRLSKIIIETQTCCYAWALIPNHFHLLLKTGRVPIATVMRRLLTGYAVSFNRRHTRQGHLFQNRYKSILCEEEAYLRELVRYIHLNPLRAGLVENMQRLDSYPYTGHSAIMGRKPNHWQEIKRVLSLYADRVSIAKRRYRSDVEKEILKGRREDLTGGGLIRSHGGWANIKAMRRANIFLKNDERILGDSDFVEKTLLGAQEHLERKYALQAQGITLNRLVELVAHLMHVDSKEVVAPGKARGRVKAKSLLCFWAVRELGMTMTALSRRLGISVPTVSVAVARGETIVMNENWILSELLNIEI